MSLLLPPPCRLAVAATGAALLTCVLAHVRWRVDDRQIGETEVVPLRHLVDYKVRPSFNGSKESPFNAYSAPATMVEVVSAVAATPAPMLQLAPMLARMIQLAPMLACVRAPLGLWAATRRETGRERRYKWMCCRRPRRQ